MSKYGRLTVSYYAKKQLLSESGVVTVENYIFLPVRMLINILQPSPVYTVKSLPISHFEYT